MPRWPFSFPTMIPFVLMAFLHHIPCSAQDLQNPTGECPDSDPANIAVTVQVTDRSGHPITGLEPVDVRILDNKKPQKILAFRAVDAAHPPLVPPKVQIIIDAVNSDAVLVARERDGVSAFLKENSGKLQYSTSIWILENAGLTRIAGPSQDAAELLSALSAAQPRLRVINRSAGIWGDTERTGQATSLLKDMVSAGPRPPGRQLVLFLSPGWPMLFNFEPDSRQWLFNDIVTISNGLRESCMSLYTLDPLSAGATLQSFGEGGNFSAYESFLKGVRKVPDAQYADLSLQVLSEHSGGQVIVGGNDIKAEIDTALRDASAWYTLTFERARGGRSTEYHVINVIVDKPNVKVRTTAGYYVSGP